MRALYLVCGLLLAGPWVALDSLAESPLSDNPPLLPAPGDRVDGLEPEVTIIQTDKGTIQEYSVAGKVYMIKVFPKKGPPYYLLDLDGDGELDVRKNDITDISIPQWVLYSW